MQAIILAAGEGRRMRPLTQSTHKTLLEIGDRTILDRLLDALATEGISKVAMVTGYRSEELRAHLASRLDFEFTWIHNERWEETNNIVSLALALEKLEIDDDVLLIESDLIIEPAILRKILDAPEPNVALVDRYRTGMDGTVVSLDGSIISSVIPPHLQGPGFSFEDKYKTLNIYKFCRDLCNGAFKRLLQFYSLSLDPGCYYEVVLGILIAGRQETVHAAIVQGERWAELDDPNDLMSTRFTFDPMTRARTLTKGQGGNWLFEVEDFNWLRNHHFPTPSVMHELRKSLEFVLTSYGSSQPILDLKMSWWLQCCPERVVALNGASAVLPLLANLWKDLQILRPEPSFGEYLRLFPNAQIYEDEPGEAVGIDPSRVSAGGVVIVVTPNNPTGSHVPSADLHDLARRNPDRLFLIDQSFIAFAGEDGIVPLLEEQPLDNVVVIESLSKSLGLPGLRVGYLYSSNLGLVSALRSELPIWAMNSLAEHFIEMLLKRRKDVALSIERSQNDRSHLKELLQALPFVRTVFSSKGNFLLVRLQGDASMAGDLVRQLLEREGIHLKDVSSKFSDGGGWLRVAVRLPTHHQHLGRAWEVVCRSLLKNGVDCI